MGDEASSGVGCSLVHISQKTARRSEEKLKRIIKDMKNLFKRKLLKAGMVLFAKLEMVCETPNPVGKVNLATRVLPLTTQIERRKL